MIDERLFTLLRIGLKISDPTEEDLSTFVGMTNEQWGTLMNIAQEQGVLGFVFDGVDTIGTSIQLQKQPKWLFEAYNGVLVRESLNKKQQSVIEELCDIWGKQGIKKLLLKGQANGFYYPNPLHRDCGDIDCYLFDQYKKGNDIIRGLGITINENWEKHSKFCYKGETIENHQFFVQTLDQKWSKALHAVLSSLVTTGFYRIPKSNAFIASAQFNALFLTYHAMEHFLAGNLKLKQITDWAMFINLEKDNIKWNAFYDVCKKYRMNSFLCVMNNIVSSQYGIHLEGKLADSSNSEEVKRFLYSIITDNNYIWDNSSSRWYGRFHFLRYVIKNSWRYKIAGQTSLRMVWLYISSYIERNF